MGLDALPEYEFIAFIDESGDAGLRKVRPLDSEGSSEWLVLSAVLMRAKYEPETFEWLSRIKKNLNVVQRRDLHFSKLSPTKKLSYCRQISELPIRAFALTSNKKNMRGYRNERAERGSYSQEFFYNFCFRMLLERVTERVKEQSLKDFSKPKKVRIIHSRRGGLRFGQTKAYFDFLCRQSRAGTTFLKKREIAWEVMDYRLLSEVPHYEHPGLWLADAVASAFHQSVDALDARRWCTDFAKELKPVLAMENRRWANFGLSLHPTPPSMAKLTDEQQQIFRYYGYKF